MSITALALSFALSTAPQDPQSHQQAVNCTGVFLYTAVLAAQAAEADPSTENQETVEMAGTLLKAADEARLAAAAREGLSTDASGAALNAWVEATSEDAEGIIGRELEPCLVTYAYAIM